MSLDRHSLTHREGSSSRRPNYINTFIEVLLGDEPSVVWPCEVAALTNPPAPSKAQRTIYAGLSIADLAEKFMLSDLASLHPEQYGSLRSEPYAVHVVCVNNSGRQELRKLGPEIATLVEEHIKPSYHTWESIRNFAAQELGLLEHASSTYAEAMINSAFIEAIRGRVLPKGFKPYSYSTSSQLLILRKHFNDSEGDSLEYIKSFVLNPISPQCKREDSGIELVEEDITRCLEDLSVDAKWYAKKLQALGGIVLSLMSARQEEPYDAAELSRLASKYARLLRPRLVDRNSYTGAVLSRIEGF